MKKVFAQITRTYLPNYSHIQYLFFLQKHFIAGTESAQIHNSKSCFKETSDLYEDGDNSEMANNGENPNGYDLVYKIQECRNLGLCNHGQQIHCYALRSGSTFNGFVSSALIDLYVKLDMLKDAHKLFDEIPEPGLVAWNSLISGYVRSGKFRKALNLFLELERSRIRSDSYSFTSVLSVCGQLSLIRFGKAVHSRIVRFGVECSTFVSNCLIDMYGKCDHIEDAIKIFDEMWFKDTFSWNSVIGASVRNQRIELAFGFLNRMPNPDTVSYNEMINGIAQFGNMEQAIEILSTMPNPNSSSWNSILTGYVNRNRPRNALEFFNKMHSSDIRMDEFTFSSILSGIARLGALTWGTLIHCCVVKSGLDESVVIGSSLIDMYSKSGQVNTAEFLFESLPGKNLVTWNAMISGYAHNENFTKVIQVFKQLKHAKDLQPDGITFLNVLSACWHNKMPLEVANRYFESMICDYKIDPTVEHCSCIIRLMGHEGEVRRAEGMIKRLGFESCAGVWRALLAACGVCGDIEVAETAASKVIELEGDGEFVHVMISNIYAQFGKWEDVGARRKMMSDNKVRKEAGLSWIELKLVATSTNQ
ncbi:putative pentatricopeptide repeat-containing protein At5g47460 [Cynara cardunculus var. scolymus]|uniref:putative pentatricopeptide repeat-containing protein At5g47460 n=1 Tax=Cynara cardunculus var. scolymus TaxID=59895 RepID=UPI000D627A0D|nr:putative pentatricopeptide repeat-containing protein At5g47460 [Cynara cardunculus var. scolymus]